MLDPVSALALACNIIEIVDFSLKAVGKFRELYRDGASSEHQELENMTARFKSLRTNFTIVKQRTRESEKLLVDDKDLHALADECFKTADELTAELNTLKISGQHKRRQVVGKFFRSMRRKSVVDGLQRKLNSYKEQLNTRILVNLRFVLFFSMVIPDAVSSLMQIRSFVVLVELYAKDAMECAPPDGVASKANAFHILTASESPGTSLVITLRRRYLNNFAPTWHLHSGILIVGVFRIIHSLTFELGSKQILTRCSKTVASMNWTQRCKLLSKACKISKAASSN